MIWEQKIIEAFPDGKFFKTKHLMGVKCNGRETSFWFEGKKEAREIFPEWLIHAQKFIYRGET